ncbi:GNAT family N-acetyltransferase [Paenibacillus thermotolerans]|uniref:GNAT family N-acetyltransferase n=1 Tax=Paenibacillus thermotolerans TaxID=3027807 RepID=UPI00236846D4|nr:MULTISPECIES: GNAT family protein [unclassified Paenibacillus]
MLKFVPMTETIAGEISQWTYPHPYDLYSMDGSKECISELMNGDYFFVEDDCNQIIGFVCCGSSARVPGGYEAGIYKDDDVLDIGLGLRPEVTGKGLGSDFVYHAVQFIGTYFGKSKIQLVVAAFNERAIKAYRKAGFTLGELFHSRVSGKQVPFVVMRSKVVACEE